MRALIHPIIVLLALNCAWGAESNEEKSTPELGRTQIVDRVVSSQFPLSDALLFVDFNNGSVARVDAEMVLLKSAVGREGSSSEWLVGAKVKVPGDSQEIALSAVLLGENGEVDIAAPELWSPLRDEKGDITKELLQAHLVEQQGVLKSWEVQMDAQKESLRRLRADAEVIADVGKIVDAREELERVSTDILTYEKYIASLKEALKLVKLLPVPRNFSQRELQLTQQLQELAQAVRQAESGEIDRRAAYEEGLQRKLEIVEETRFDDLETLENTYQRLSERIARLEEAQ